MKAELADRRKAEGRGQLKLRRLATQQEGLIRSFDGNEIHYESSGEGFPIVCCNGLGCASFFWVYFLVVGNFAIGFMRYLLPIYPLFCLFAAVFFYQLLNVNRKLYAIRYLLYAFLILLLIWPFSFLHIYMQPNTRVLATNWISQNIPAGKTIALEHWDDGLPLFGQQKYNVLTLPLYDPDTTKKWTAINAQITQTDYVIIASNRLYVPLMKMTDCAHLPIGRCYTQTAEYYKKLFDGSLGFQKVTEFSIFPSLEIGNWKLEIRDEIADESFTVYDHPKVMIFKRE